MVLRAPGHCYTGARYLLARLVNLVGSNLDRSDYAPFWAVGVPSLVVRDTATLRNGAGLAAE